MWYYYRVDMPWYNHNHHLTHPRRQLVPEVCQSPDDCGYTTTRMIWYHYCRAQRNYSYPDTWCSQAYDVMMFAAKMKKLKMLVSYHYGPPNENPVLQQRVAPLRIFCFDFGTRSKSDIFYVTPYVTNYLNGSTAPRRPY